MDMECKYLGVERGIGNICRWEEKNDNNDMWKNMMLSIKDQFNFLN